MNRKIMLAVASIIFMGIVLIFSAEMDDTTFKFAIAFFGSILLVMLVATVLQLSAEYDKVKTEKIKAERNKIDRTYEVDWIEFESFGRQALALQTMKSFIAETEIGRQIEFTVDEILEEVNNR